jgi:hypothetical protein
VHVSFLQRNVLDERAGNSNRVFAIPVVEHNLQVQELLGVDLGEHCLLVVAEEGIQVNSPLQQVISLFT